MNVNRLKVLDSADIDRLIELTREYQDGVLNGSITGYGQPAAEESAEAAALVEKLIYIKN